jgi:hypothetical protein
MALRYFISRTEDGKLNYGRTDFNGDVQSAGTTFEIFEDETSFRQQLEHYNETALEDIYSDPDYVPIRKMDLAFPYPGRDIRVFISFEQIAKMEDTEYFYLIPYGKAVPHQFIDHEGVVLWFEDLACADHSLTDRQVITILERYGADVVIRTS